MERIASAPTVAAGFPWLPEMATPVKERTFLLTGISGLTTPILAERVSVLSVAIRTSRTRTAKGLFSIPTAEVIRLAASQNRSYWKTRLFGALGMPASRCFLRRNQELI